MLSRKHNYQLNNALSEAVGFGKMLDGQAVCGTADFRYGICRMSFNGCEVIAVHNALVYLGKPQPLCKIAFRMEKYRMLAGFFGCNPFRLGKSLEYFGAECRRTRSVSEAENAESFIMTYWTKLPFLSTLHTVFCIRRKDGFEVHNRYSNRSSVYFCRSITEFAGKRKPVAIYITERK